MIDAGLGVFLFGEAPGDVALGPAGRGVGASVGRKGKKDLGHAAITLALGLNG